MLVCIQLQIIFLKSKCLAISSVRSISNCNGSDSTRLTDLKDEFWEVIIVSHRNK